MNYGDNYKTELEFDDDAFQRRTCVFKYEPSKKDVINFFKENDYQNFLQILINKPDVVYKHYSLKDEEGYEFEQTTNLGSWFSWNQRLKQLHNLIVSENPEKKYKKDEKGNQVETTYHDLTIDVVLADFIKSGKLFFNEFMINIIQGHLTQIKSLQSLDIEKEVLAKGEIPSDYLDKKDDILLRTKDILFKNPNFVSKYLKNIYKLYDKRSEILVQLCKELKNKESEKEYLEAYSKILENASDDLLDKLMNMITQ